MKQLKSHLGSFKTEKGYDFTVFAKADEVLLKVNGNTYPMNEGKSHKNHWNLEIEGINDGSIYSYIIDGVEKADPFADKIISIMPNEIDSVTYNSTYSMKEAKNNKEVAAIFEVYLPEMLGRTYQEKAESIIERAKGFSHVQIMPFVHTPADITLGYKTSSNFAPNARYGELDDFKELIDMLHKAKFGVILDFVIFEYEEFSKKGLNNFGKDNLFGRGDQHPTFTGFYYDISNKFVRDYLMSVMNYYAVELRADGIRIDGVNELIFFDPYQKNINKKGLKFLKDALKDLPNKTLVFADLLTHQSIEELGLERINKIEGSMFMFQIHKIINKGKKYWEENLDAEIKNLNKTFQWIAKNSQRIAFTINHDIHIDGFDYKMTNGGLQTPEHWKMFKRLLLGVPGIKVMYQDATVEPEYLDMVNKISQGATFEFSIIKSGHLVYTYLQEGNKYLLIFDLFGVGTSLEHTKYIKLP